MHFLLTIIHSLLSPEVVKLCIRQVSEFMNFILLMFLNGKSPKQISTNRLSKYVSSLHTNVTFLYYFAHSGCQRAGVSAPVQGL